PPAKRRRIAGPKERTTEYLDLERVRRDHGFDERSQRNLDRLVGVLRKQKKVVIIAGAGISVSAGIPDFRSKEGLFASLPKDHKVKGSGKHLFDASVYKHDSTTEKFHKMVCDLVGMVKSAEPTLFHHMLASLAAEGRLTRLYTQNVDCIDANLPPLATNVPLNPKGPWPKTIQLHGSVEQMVCSKCGTIRPLAPELFDSHEPPLCDECKTLDAVRTTYGGKRSHGIGRLRPRMVLYNEYNPDEEAIGNVSSADLKGRPDAVIVVGTSLKIPGVRRLVRELCQATRSKRGGFTAWINVDSEPQHNDFKDCWDMVVRAKADDIAHFAQLPRWDEPAVDGNAILLSEEDEELREQWLRRNRFEVQLGRSSQEPQSSSSSPQSKIEVVLKSGVDKVQGIPTPTASPRMRPSLPDQKQQPRGKQSKLSFGRKPLPDSSGGGDATTKKRKKSTASKPAKRTKTAAAAPPQKNTVTKAFRSVKMGAVAIPLEEKPNGPADPIKIEDSTSGKPISSRSSPCIGVSTATCKGSIVAAGSERPTTPTHNCASIEDTENTISPTSKPRGMERLVD
ncbi:DHS-like NAD/FAD-binding domain-containing protein, partial [Sodiomyces alkalinus F11]